MSRLVVLGGTGVIGRAVARRARSPRNTSCSTAGDGTPNPGEWVFVKRVLDRREGVVLSRGVDQISVAANIAALAGAVADKAGYTIETADTAGGRGNSPPVVTDGGLVRCRR